MVIIADWAHTPNQPTSITSQKIDSVQGNMMHWRSHILQIINLCNKILNFWIFIRTKCPAGLTLGSTPCSYQQHNQNACPTSSCSLSGCTELRLLIIIIIIQCALVLPTPILHIHTLLNHCHQHVRHFKSHVKLVIMKDISKVWSPMQLFVHLPPEKVKIQP